MVMAQSLFKLLKFRAPASVIDVVAPAWTHPLLARMPEINEAIALPLAHGQLGLRTRWRLGRSLRPRGYSHAIVLPNSWKSAIIPLAAGAARRTGFVGEWRWGLLNDTRRLKKAALPRMVDRFLTLGLEPQEMLLSASPPQLVPQVKNAHAALARLNWPLLPQTPILGLAPGAEYGAAKRWPAAYFADVAAAKIRAGWQVWLFGSEKDAVITATLETEIQSRGIDIQGRCLDLGGRTTLAEAIDLLSLTQAVVTNDSGLMHVAAALGRRVVALFGSSDPGHTPPLSDLATNLSLQLSCSPCFARECPLGHLRCLKDLPPERVLAALN